MRIFQINPIYLGKPSASRDEILPQEFHHQVDGAYGIPHANIAAAAVLPRVKREAGMVVIVKRAECLMVFQYHPHLFRTRHQIDVWKNRKFITYCSQTGLYTKTQEYLTGTPAAKVKGKEK